MFALKFVQLGLQKDIFFSNVGKKEGNLSLVVRVLQNVVDDLQLKIQPVIQSLYKISQRKTYHRGKTCSSSNQTNVLLEVFLDVNFLDGTFDINGISNLKLMEVLRKRTCVVSLDEQLEVTLLIIIKWSIWTNNYTSESVNMQNSK